MRKKLRIVIASPNDVPQERRAADKIIRTVTRHGASVETFLWETGVPPGFSKLPVQIGLIDAEARITNSDVVLVLFSTRLGTPIGPGKPTGAQHEFQTALESWRLTGRPHIMVYFNSSPFNPKTEEELEQYVALMQFRMTLPKNGLYGSYEGPADFARLFRKHLPMALKRVRGIVTPPFSTKIYDDHVGDIKPEEHSRLCVSESAGLYSSFRPENSEKSFVRLAISSTPGYVPNPKHETDRRQPRWKPLNHKIHVIRDPIRPFEIQIGEHRSRRYGKDPREVPFEGVPDRTQLETLYPLMLDPGHRWLRMVFAELLSDPGALEYMQAKEPDPTVKTVIARNPSAPESVRTKGCPFCDPEFREQRRIRMFESDAVIMANDFPFGPYLHYVVYPEEEVHSWATIEERHLFEMNWLSHQVLNEKRRRETLGAAGVRIGFNSSIRHLVLGRRTRSSAGASISHVHKQIWGMAPHSVNLADHLRAICLSYERQKPARDYLEEYYLALKKAGLVIWEDKKKSVALYVPFGQIAVHEMQIMIRRPGRRTFLDLDEDEIRALSLAEYIVSRLYGRLDINSFNEILLSLPFEDTESEKFRLIFTFITREVDLAVSELSLLYVVDRQPSDTVLEINRVWPSRNPADLESADGLGGIG